MYTKRVEQAMMCMTRQCWEQGIVAQALLETDERDELELVVHDMILRQSADGRLCNVENTPAVTDSAFCIPAVYLLGKEKNDAKMLEAAQKNIDFLLKDAEHAEDGTLYHMIHTQHVWADSAAYLPYALALTGHPKEGLQQMTGICNRLYNKESGLYFHMWDDGKQDYLRPLAWGIGNGWILSGMLRLYLELEKEGRQRKEYEQQKEYTQEKEVLLKKWRILLDTMLSHETDNHLFHDVMNDTTTFEESETAELVAYSIYKGVKAGILEENYLERADNIRKAVEKKVTANGLVMDSASSPDFVRPGTAAESQANYLMMEQAFRTVSRLKKSEL